MDITQPMHLPLQTLDGDLSRVEKRGHLLSKSMEKTFRRYESRPGARHAFTEAEAATYLAHQIRVLRTQRKWSQRDLAKRLGTTQAVVSRIEDADYGRVSFKTMVALARAFDVAPVLKFISTIDLMRERWVINREQMEVLGFDDEAARVAFLDGPVRPNVIASATAVSAVTTQVLTAEAQPFSEKRSPVWSSVTAATATALAR